jgi:hypothetical protein
MILVRDIFQIKYGRMKEAKAAWKEMMPAGSPPSKQHPRLLTDLTGPYYTLVFENTYESLTDYEKVSRQEMSSPGMAAAYQKFVPLVDSGRREIFTIVE